MTLTITNAPAGFTLDGTDNQCGATNKASAVGVASLNASGNVTLNFTIVTAPAGKPVHVSAVVSPANGAGTWTDSVGNSGPFAFFGNTAGLPARPLPASGLPASIITTTEIAAGAVGGTDINPAEVQARVSGACPGGQAVTGVNTDGSVTCIAVDASVDFRADSHSTQTVGSSTTPVLWSLTTYNNGGGAYSAPTGAYTIPATGLYLVTAATSWSTTTTAASGYLCSYLWNNTAGTWFDFTCVPPTTTADFMTPALSTAVRLTAGTAISVRVNQAGGGTVTLKNNQTGTHFSVTRLR